MTPLLDLLGFLPWTFLAHLGGDSMPETQSLVQLNPFGSAFTAATWVTLVALNLWCWKKVLGHQGKKTRES